MYIVVDNICPINRHPLDSLPASGVHEEHGDDSAGEKKCYHNGLTFPKSSLWQTPFTSSDSLSCGF